MSTSDSRDRARSNSAASALDRGFHALLDTIRKHIPEVPRAVAVFFTLSFLVVLGGTWGFGALAEEVLEGETRRFDTAVLRWAHAQATPTLDQVALEITALGNTAVLVVILLVASALLWVTRHRYSVLLLWIATFGSIAMTWVLKLTFGRTRPSVVEYRAHYTVDSASFPSGHALGAIVLYAVLAYLIARLQARTVLRRTTILVALVIIVLIGSSRIYLGVHYPSDVVGGYAMGLAWAALCALGIEAVSYFRTGRVWLDRPEEGEPTA